MAHPLTPAGRPRSRPRRTVTLSAVTSEPAAGSDPGPIDTLDVLVSRAKDGDVEAFEELVTMTYVDTYSLAMRITGNEDDARDVTQEAYLRAYRSLKRFRGDARFTTWLYRITANCAATNVGKRNRHRHDVLDESAGLADTDPAGDPEAQAAGADLRARVDQALLQLPPKLRSVVVLRDVYDLSHDAIAAELGISVSAAKVRLHRARRRLKDQLFPSADRDAADEVEEALDEV